MVLKTIFVIILQNKMDRYCVYCNKNFKNKYNLARHQRDNDVCNAVKQKTNNSAEKINELNQKIDELNQKINELTNEIFYLKKENEIINLKTENKNIVNKLRKKNELIDYIFKNNYY